VLAVVLVASFSVCTNAGAFLKTLPPKDKHVSRGAVEETLLRALSMDAGKMQKMEKNLKPMYAALPKNGEGCLDSKTVRYALHRYFVQKHGWYVKGLDPTNVQHDSSAPASILRNRAPAFIQVLLEEQMHGQGWHLKELAIYATALTELVRMEAVLDLEEVYKMLSLNPRERLSESQTELVIDGYIMQYIMDENTTFATYEDMLTEVLEVYPGWYDFKMWAHDLHLGLDVSDAPRRNPFVTGMPFGRMADTVQELGHAYGTFQQQECNSLKSFMETMELQGTGRVALADFYRVGLEDVWRFWESPEYLRHLGALDESRPDEPSVIIPNFVAGHSNCVASSSFIEVCCSNGCDNMMSALEKDIASPAVTVSRMAEAVMRLPDVPGNLSTQLLGRLDEIAQLHEGQVPLHGRLFSQWLHHVFPLECPYPALEAQAQLTREEFEVEGAVAMLEFEDQQSHVSVFDRAPKTQKDKLQALPWSSVEVLVTDSLQPKAANKMRQFMFVVAIISLAVPLVRVSKALITDDKIPSSLV